MAAVSTFSIWVRPACHHRMWSFRNSVLTCAVVPVLSSRRLRETSNDDQSSTASPTARSTILGWAWCGCAAGFGASAGAGLSTGAGLSAGAGGALDEEDAACPSAGGPAGASSGGTSAGGPSRCAIGFNDDPGNPALLLELSPMRASLGCGAARLEAPDILDLYPVVAHLHSPTRLVCSSCPLNRGGTRLQPGHVHSVSWTS